MQQVWVDHSPREQRRTPLHLDRLEGHRAMFVQLRTAGRILPDVIRHAAPLLLAIPRHGLQLRDELQALPAVEHKGPRLRRRGVLRPARRCRRHHQHAVLPPLAPGSAVPTLREALSEVAAPARVVLGIVTCSEHGAMLWSRRRTAGPAGSRAGWSRRHQHRAMLRRIQSRLSSIAPPRGVIGRTCSDVLWNHKVDLWILMSFLSDQVELSCLQNTRPWSR
mmetsp:Transcript_112928/g.258607  ORF Transcript_112928/g.258607 Transcript_112928/m.258607 type:complete len:221 (-) Transcript_112928:632-1294(-)